MRQRGNFSGWILELAYVAVRNRATGFWFNASLLCSDYDLREGFTLEDEIADFCWSTSCSYRYRTNGGEKYVHIQFPCPMIQL